MEVSETLDVSTRKAWRAWLRKNHKTAREIWLVYYKKASGKTGVSYNDAVEEALCYGWIDTTVKTLDAERYLQRFAPRKKGSSWSGPNLERIKRLVANGQMTLAGAVHLPSRKAAREFQKQHDWRTTAPATAPKELAAALKKHPKAAAFWKTLAPGYRRLYGRVIAEAKREETRIRRVAKVVAYLEKGIKHPLL